MGATQRVPTSLKIVAILFILGGVSAAIQMVTAFAHGKVILNFGVLELFVGPGLLALRPGWRTCALVDLWAAMILVPISGFLMLSHSGNLDFGLTGRKVGDLPKAVGLAMIAVMFALSVRKYRVLTRPDVRARFGLGTQA